MAKAKREIEESLKLIDVVIELVDARIPFSSKNPDVTAIIKNKPRVILLNKADLADDRVTKEFENYYNGQGYICITTNSKTGKLNKVMDAVRTACKEKIERDKARGMINRPIRAMILGIPNVGKSTFINSYAKKACAATGDKPGVTKGKQWIRLSKDLELLDTPGILWPKFEDNTIGRNIAFIGSINEEILDTEELSVKLAEYIRDNYPGLLSRKYGIDETGTGAELLENITIKRACLKSGGVPDTLKMSKMFLFDFRSGKIGHISLERVENIR